MVVLNLTKEEAEWLWYRLVADVSEGEPHAERILYKLPLPPRRNLDKELGKLGLERVDEEVERR